MDKYRFTQGQMGGYEHTLTDGKIYDGVEVPGIFQEPYLVVYEDGKKIASAYLFRFEKVVEELA